MLPLIKGPCVLHRLVRKLMLSTQQGLDTRQIMTDYRTIPAEQLRGKVKITTCHHNSKRICITLYAGGTQRKMTMRWFKLNNTSGNMDCNYLLYQSEL
jgi:hypothetical protein